MGGGDRYEDCFGLNTRNFDVYNLTFEFPAEIFVLIRCYSWFSMHQVSLYFGIFQKHLSVFVKHFIDKKRVYSGVFQKCSAHCALTATRTDLQRNFVYVFICVESLQQQTTKRGF